MTDAIERVYVCVALSDRRPRMLCEPVVARIRCCALEDRARVLEHAERVARPYLSRKTAEYGWEEDDWDVGVCEVICAYADVYGGIPE